MYPFTKAVIEFGTYPRCEYWNPQVGEGATELWYSDTKAYTVIERKGKTIKIQRDKVTRLNEPEFIPGGFAGHCTNQRSIKYAYERDPEGAIETYTMRKNGRWVRKGSKMTGMEVIPGRSEFYDYNF